MTVVAVSAPARFDGVLADVPTWRELGHDVVWSAWRGVLGPKGMSAEELAFWEGALRKVVESGEWKEIEQENYWRTEFRDSTATS